MSAETIIVLLACPSCDLDVAVPVSFRCHAKVPASADYPGDPAEVEVWGGAVPCRCGHWLEVEAHRDELTHKVKEHLEAFAP